MAPATAPTANAVLLVIILFDVDCWGFAYWIL